MKWVETIQLRVGENNRESLERQLVGLLLGIDRGGALENIKLYRHAVMKNDLIVHFYWRSETAEPRGSAVGLCLIHALKAYGLISHSVWVEEVVS